MKNYFRAGIIFILIVALNYVIKDIYASVDLTEDNRFSLSSASVDIARSPEDSKKVLITYFTSKDLPQNMIPVNQSIRDILSQYQVASSGKIEMVNRYPQENEEDKKIAEEKEIPELKYNVVEDSGYEVSSGYSALQISFDERVETIPIITSTSNLEYQITSAIKRVVKPERKKIGIIKNHTYISQQFLAVALSQEYEIKPVEFNELNEDLDALIVSGISEDLTEEEQINFDQFILAGKPVIAFIDRAIINPNNFSYKLNESNINDIFSSYGVEITPTLVADFKSHDTITYSENGSQLKKEYPLWIRPDEGINRAHPVTSSIRTFTLPWASEIKIQEEQGVESLIDTSNRGYAFNFEELPNIGTETIFQPPIPSLEGKTVGVQVSGNQQSFFATKEGLGEKEGALQNGEVNMIVVGSAHIVQDAFLRSSQSNLLFVRNMIEYLSGAENFGELRSKSIIDRPINTTETEKNNIKIISIASSSAIIILAGAIIYLAKRSRKKRFLSKI